MLEYVLLLAKGLRPWKKIAAFASHEMKRERNVSQQGI